MIPYILFVFFNNYPGGIAVEFANKDACQVAAAQIINERGSGKGILCLNKYNGTPAK